MQDLGSTLRKIQANFRVARSYPQDSAATDESPPVCSRCEGRGWLSAPDPRSTYSRKAMPCPVCRVTGKQNFFADLHVEEGNSEAITRARDFALSPTGWLVFVGGVGTGKTRLLNAILSTWRGSLRHALASAELLDYWRMAVDTDSLGPTFNGYCTAPAFALDDLGAEKATDWGKERLTMFLDFRYSRALPTAIATNLGRGEIAQRLGERLADRVYDKGTGLVKMVTLDVPSFRSDASDYRVHGGKS